MLDFVPKSVKRILPERLRKSSKRILIRILFKKSLSVIRAIELAESAAKRKEWQEAVERWKLVLDNYGDKAPADVYIKLSCAYRGQGDFEAAEDSIIRGMAKHRNNLKLLGEYAEVAISQKEWLKAAVRCQFLLDTFGDKAPAKVYVRLCRAYRGQGDFEAADAIITSGMAKHPGEPKLSIEYAENAMAKRDWSEAVVRWQSVLDNHGEESPTKVYVQLSRAYHNQGNFESSDFIIHQGIDKHPGDVNIVNECARLLLLREPQKDTSKNFALLHPSNPYQYSYHDFQNKLREGNKKEALECIGISDNKTERLFLDMEKVYPYFIDHQGWDEPGTNIAFACVCNHKFLPGLEYLVLSLKRIYPSFNCDFYVYHDGSLSDFAVKRLSSIYGKFHFIGENPDKYNVGFGNAPNHKRIGALGYLTLEALKLDNYERVIILDVDMMVLSDISPLWTTPGINVVMDAGARPFAVISEYTGKPVFNSGVLSLPQSLLQGGAYKRAMELLDSLDECTCPRLNTFADQKFWNIFLSKEDVNYLPSNFNANKSLIEKFFPHQLHNVSILHFTGPKPWFFFANENYLEQEDRANARQAQHDNPVTFDLWLTQYKTMLGAVRKSAFRRDMSEKLEQYRLAAPNGRCLLIGNGPSLNETDLDLFKGTVKIAFNWFVHHPKFDTIAPDHLILPSHQFFGGWNTYEPQFPAGFLDALKGHKHKPALWVSYYFKDYVESVKELDGYQVCYFLFEKPHKMHADELGWMGMDLSGYLTDNRTGVLTAGIPLAVHLGCRDIFLVGCDSNYQTVKGGDYFYSQELHTSASTKVSSLQATWKEDGTGPECYRIAFKELEGRGIRIWDATVNGALKAIPKFDYSQPSSMSC